MGESSTEERRKRVVIGELSGDFLRLNSTADVAEVSTGGIDVNLTDGGQQRQQQQGQTPPLLCAATPFYNAFMPPRTRGRLNVTMVQAKLNKNYGLVRMDPYCRLRIGAVVFETPTDPSGGKTPHWNRTVHGYLPEGIDSIYLEIFDERAFTFDERIAWTHITLPQSIFSGETIDEWYSLSGNQGEGKEGMVNLVISLDSVLPGQGATGAAGATVPVMLYSVPTGQIPGPRFTQTDVKELREMFPAVDEEVIIGILEEKYGNKEAAVNALLAITSE